MKNITLYIETRDSLQEVELEDELSIGRTELAQFVVDDVGLSRVNTTFFRDGEMLLVVDENSLNGTFLNGEKIGDRPVRVLDGDIVKIGSETEIKVEIASEKKHGKNKNNRQLSLKQKPNPSGERFRIPNHKPEIKQTADDHVLSALSIFAIVFFATDRHDRCQNVRVRYRKKHRLQVAYKIRYSEACDRSSGRN